MPIPCFPFRFSLLARFVSSTLGLTIALSAPVQANGLLCFNNSSCHQIDDWIASGSKFVTGVNESSPDPEFPDNTVYSLNIVNEAENLGMVFESDATLILNAGDLLTLNDQGKAVNAPGTLTVGTAATNGKLELASNVTIISSRENLAEKK